MRVQSEGVCIPIFLFFVFSGSHAQSVLTSEADSSDSRRLAGSCVDLPTLDASAEEETVLSFYAHGDSPYSLEQKYCLNDQLRAINMTNENAMFTVHVGDIKKGAWPCNSSAYSDIAEIYSHPSNTLSYDHRDVFFLVGDNEWTNCGNPDDAWDLWTENFGLGNKYGFGTFAPEKNIVVARQTKSFRKPGVPREENFAFYTKQVLCIGLNMVGGKSFVDRSFDNKKLRLTQNFQFTRTKLRAHKERGMKAAVVFGHAAAQAPENGRLEYFGEPFMKLLRDEFPDLPVMYIHGDWHDYCVRKMDPKNDNLHELELEDGGYAPPVLVSIVKNKDPADDSFFFKIDQRGGLYSPPGSCNPIYEMTWSPPPETKGPQYKLLKKPHGLLGLCEGDCDEDIDCQEGLVCLEDDAPVPGCSGFRVSGKEYCFDNTTAPFKSPTNSPSNMPSKMPSAPPSMGPKQPPPYSVAPSRSPTVTPTKKKLPELYLYPKGIPPKEKYPLGECQGDCGKNSDCAPGLLCYKRSSSEPIPGCAGVSQPGKDFCHKPQTNTLVLKAKKSVNPKAFPLKACQGYCLRNSDCKGRLKCFKRDGTEQIPGCKGKGKFAKNYCFDPKLL